MFLIKTLYQFVKDSFVAPSINVTKNFNIFQKNSVYPKTFCRNSLLLLTSLFLQNLLHRTMKNRCRNCYILNGKSYLHWRGIATYLYSQVAKLLLTSCNKNCPKKNLMYLKQVYTFIIQPDKNQKSEIFTAFEKIHRSFINTLKSEETKSQIKGNLLYITNSYFYTYTFSLHLNISTFFYTYIFLNLLHLY